MKRILFVLIVGLLLSIPSVVLAQEAPGEAHGGPGFYSLDLKADENGIVGVVEVWNSPKKLHIKVIPAGEWEATDAQIYVGADPVPTKKGKPVPGKFPWVDEYDPPAKMHDLVLDLNDDLEFSWGSQSADERVQNVAVHVDLVRF